MIEEDPDCCPLCMEELDLTDKNFTACQCGYQVCLWCWHQIKNEYNGLCPACRTPYPEEAKPKVAVNREDVVRKTVKQRKQKEKKDKKASILSTNTLINNTNSNMDGNHSNYIYNTTTNNNLNRNHHLNINNNNNNINNNNRNITAHVNRRSLSNVRVLQRNLVYVIGLPVHFALEEKLRKNECFGQYGKIIKVVVNKSHLTSDRANATASAYVTFAKKEDAHNCIQAIDCYYLDGKQLRASFGTTKYCNFFLRNLTCSNPECLYLHELGDDIDSFTKEEMQAGKGAFRECMTINNSPPPDILTNNNDDKLEDISYRGGPNFPPPPSTINNNGPNNNMKTNTNRNTTDIKNINRNSTQRQAQSAAAVNKLRQLYSVPNDKNDKNNKNEKNDKTDQTDRNVDVKNSVSISSSDDNDNESDTNYKRKTKSISPSMNWSNHIKEKTSNLKKISKSENQIKSQTDLVNDDEEININKTKKVEDNIPVTRLLGPFGIASNDINDTTTTTTNNNKIGTINKDNTIVSAWTNPIHIQDNSIKTIGSNTPSIISSNSSPKPIDPTTNDDTLNKNESKTVFNTSSLASIDAQFNTSSTSSLHPSFLLNTILDKTIHNDKNNIATTINDENNPITPLNHLGLGTILPILSSDNDHNNTSILPSPLSVPTGSPSSLISSSPLGNTTITTKTSSRFAFANNPAISKTPSSSATNISSHTQSSFFQPTPLSTAFFNNNNNDKTNQTRLKSDMICSPPLPPPIETSKKYIDLHTKHIHNINNNTNNKTHTNVHNKYNINNNMNISKTNNNNNNNNNNRLDKVGTTDGLAFLQQMLPNVNISYGSEFPGSHNNYHTNSTDINHLKEKHIHTHTNKLQSNGLTQKNIPNTHYNYNNWQTYHPIPTLSNNINNNIPFQSVWGQPNISNTTTTNNINKNLPDPSSPFVSLATTALVDELGLGIGLNKNCYPYPPPSQTYISQTTREIHNYNDHINTNHIKDPAIIATQTSYTSSVSNSNNNITSNHHRPTIS